MVIALLVETKNIIKHTSIHTNAFNVSGDTMRIIGYVSSIKINKWKKNKYARVSVIYR